MKMYGKKSKNIKFFKRLIGFLPSCITENKVNILNTNGFVLFLFDAPTDSVEVSDILKQKSIK